MAAPAVAILRGIARRRGFLEAHATRNQGCQLHNARYLATPRCHPIASANEPRPNATHQPA